MFFIYCYCSARFGLLPPTFFFCCGSVLPCFSCFTYIFLFPNISFSNFIFLLFVFVLLLFLNFILFIFFYSRFLLVIYFIHISVYMPIPTFQFIPPPPPPHQLLSPLVSIMFVLYISLSIWSFFFLLLFCHTMWFEGSWFPGR